ncbi:MAG: dTDP-4-dehydrorhamnose reductase [Woeseia sp.]
MNKILLVGRSGQLGQALESVLRDLFEVVALDSSQVDLTDEMSIRQSIRKTAPNILVNAAAYTAVDQAEAERSKAFAINAEAPRIMSQEMLHIGGFLLHYSTDFVFDGEKHTPYLEDDAPGPLNVYGASKLEGDNAIRQSGVPHMILRTSWVYGRRGTNFPKTIAKYLIEKKVVRVVADQIGTPTWSRDIASTTARVLLQACPDKARLSEALSGIYNYTASGSASWFDVAEKVAFKLRRAGQKVAELYPVSAAEFGAKAKRPAYSVLDCRKIQQIFEVDSPPWHASFDECFRDIGYL